MHGAAVTFAERLVEGSGPWDLFLITDMMDAALFASLVRRRFPGTPIALYFHENQLDYPWSPRDNDKAQGRDAHYVFINYASALAADRIYFNSEYHRRSFLDGLPAFLRRYPDFQNTETVDAIRRKSATLPLGLELGALDEARPANPRRSARDRPRPRMLWNHRWEHDKRPLDFFRLMERLLERGFDFDLVLLGQRSRELSGAVREARDHLAPKILHDGPVDAFETYASWLWHADILPVTSRQDFFGGSVAEAVHCGCHPVLPRRLAYPEHLPGAPVFYDDEDGALSLLENLLSSGAWRRPFDGAGRMRAYDWQERIADYDEKLAEAARAAPRHGSGD